MAEDCISIRLSGEVNKSPFLHRAAGLAALHGLDSSPHPSLTELAGTIP